MSIKLDNKIELIVLIIALTVGISANLVLKDREYMISRIFMLTWLSGYYISFFKLSELQIEYQTSTKLYIFFVAFIPYIIEIFYAKLFRKKKLFFEKGKFNIKQNSTVIFMFIAHLLIFAYESKTTGIPLLLGTRVESIGAIHVIGEIFLRVAFYIAAYNVLISKKYLYSGIVLYGIVYTVLVMSRSLTIHFVLYIILLAFLLKKFSVKKIAVILTVALVFFGLMGNVRNGADFSISEYASMRTDNKIVSWVYSYIGPNYNNLALQMEQGTPTNTLSNTLAPILTVTGLDKKIAWFDRSYIYIGKLNVGTIYRDYVSDMGNFKAVLLFVSHLILVVGIYYRNSSSGMKFVEDVVILSEIGISFFTNHFTSSIFWISILIIYLLEKLFSRKVTF
jgi:oligosaccharide repeat unit polymerase